LLDWLSFRAERAPHECRGCAPKCTVGCQTPVFALFERRYGQAYGHAVHPQHATSHPAVPPLDVQAPIQPFPPAPFYQPASQSTETPGPAPSRVIPRESVIEMPPLTVPRN
jgi:hypothetical protein